MLVNSEQLCHHPTRKSAKYINMCFPKETIQMTKIMGKVVYNILRCKFSTITLNVLKIFYQILLILGKLLKNAVVAVLAMLTLKVECTVMLDLLLVTIFSDSSKSH